LPPFSKIRSNSPSDSELSSDDEDLPTIDETITERIIALRDIIPPTTRTAISNVCSSTYGAITATLGFSGKALFVLSTSALLLGVPWALAFAEEQQVMDMEKEMRARELGSELLAPGTTASALNAQLGAQQGKPAL
jgi:import receptor subunit TOM22